MTPSIHSHKWMVDLRSRFHNRRPRRFGNLACSLTRTSVRVRQVTHFGFCWDFLRGESAHKDGSLRKAVEDLRLDFAGGKSVLSAGAVESKIPGLKSLS